MCTNRWPDDATKEHAVTVFVHELTHCQQGCENRKKYGCENCMCNELQAYRRSFPGLSDEELQKKAVDSCKSKLGAFGGCKNAEAANGAGGATGEGAVRQLR